MRLRKVKTIDPLVILGSQKQMKRNVYYKVFFRTVLFLMVMIMLWKFSVYIIEVNFLSVRVYEYVNFCITQILNMSLLKIFLLFAPALIFDTTRYYIVNTVIFFVSIFKRKVPDDFDPSSVFPLVSVILPAYNEGENIKRTLDCMRESDYPNLEIIVVDDFSSDQTSRICEYYHRKGWIVHIRTNDRGGKPAALNYGFKLAKGEYIAHFDGDVVVRRSAIREAMRPFKDPKVGIVSGNLKVYNDRKNLLTGLQAAEYGMGISIWRRWLSATDSLQIASGAFSLFRREILESLYGVDAEMGEDLDVTLKGRKLGYKVAFAPKAVALTIVPDTFIGLLKQRMRWDACYIRLNLRKHINIANLSRFRFGDFSTFMSDIFSNLILTAVLPVYIVWIILYELEFALFIFTITYLFYTIMNLGQFIMVAILSESFWNDTVLILYAPLFFIYGLCLRFVRIFAYVAEIFRFTFISRGHYFPDKVSDNVPKF